MCPRAVVVLVESVCSGGESPPRLEKMNRISLLNNRTRKRLIMNGAPFSCYSLAVEGSSACSGANHALANGGGPSRLQSALRLAVIAELDRLGVTNHQE
jgi:hypothetical protein